MKILLNKFMNSSFAKIFVYERLTLYLGNIFILPKNKYIKFSDKKNYIHSSLLSVKSSLTIWCYIY